MMKSDKTLPEKDDRYGEMPIVQSEDVNYSEVLATEEDREAVQRAEDSEHRQG